MTWTPPGPTPTVRGMTSSRNAVWAFGSAFAVLFVLSCAGSQKPGAERPDGTRVVRGVCCNVLWGTKLGSAAQARQNQVGSMTCCTGETS